MEIKGKVAIVTGASQGIGLAVARLLSRRGAKIVLAARSANIIKEIEKEMPDSLAVATDMRSQKDIENLFAKAMKKYGRTDILINNAGQGMYGPVEKIDIESYKKVMELNLFGVLRAMQQAIPIMRKQGEGAIINVSSGVSKRYLPGIGAYSSTKYALNALSFIARQELERDNIKVSTIFPKVTSTNFLENAVGARPAWGGRQIPQIDPPEKVAEKIAELINSEEAEIEL